MVYQIHVHELENIFLGELATKLRPNVLQNPIVTCAAQFYRVYCSESINQELTLFKVAPGEFLRIQDRIVGKGVKSMMAIKPASY